MTNQKDSCTETTPISVSSDDSRNKEEGDKINEDMGQRMPKRGVDSTLGLPPSENRESGSGDVPRPQQSEPLEAVKEKNIALKQEEPGTEPSQGTDNGDDENVIILNEALSRLGVKDEDGPEGLSGCSLGSETLTRVPETTSLGSSVDAESDECGGRGSGRLSESSLESDGNVSDDESDIDSDGISSSLPQDSREQLVARGPTRRHASQPRHQGKPYDRQPASPYVVTREQDDDLMELVRGPQGPLDQTYVDAWQGDIVSNDQSHNASGIFEIGDSDQTLLENIIATIVPPTTSDVASASAPMQSTIPTVVVDKIEEKETQTKMTKRKRTPKTKKGTPSPSKPSTKSECRSSVQQTPAQQQTPANVQPGLSQGQGHNFQPASAMMEDAMSIIENDLRRETVNGASVEQLSQEVSQPWSHGSGIQASSEQMPVQCTRPMYPAQPVQQFIPPVSLFSETPQTTLRLPPVQQNAPFQATVIIQTNDVASQQHIALDGQVLHQQTEGPLLTSTQTMPNGTGQSQLFTRQPTMTTGLRPLLPSSSQYRLTTAGTLGQIFAFPFQSFRPVVLPNLHATQTRPNTSNSRLQKIVPKPT